MYQQFKNYLFGECVCFFSELLFFSSKEYLGFENLNGSPFSREFAYIEHRLTI